jgi:protein-tyrosine phosphatase
MIDLHCHILPAIDDGSPDIETSCKMLRMAAADGITHIAATPHFKYDEKPTLEDIGRSLQVLQMRTKEEGIPVRLLRGADVRLTYELINGIQRRGVPVINGSRYFLLELPDLLPPHIDNLLFTIRLEGFVPVITHPERNYSLLSAPDKIEGLRDSGALFQLTAMSITGEFGSQIRSFTQMLFRKGLADFVATDAHDPFFRKPVLSQAYKEVVRIYDEREAQRVFFENPAALIENREIKT